DEYRFSLPAGSFKGTMVAKTGKPPGGGPFGAGDPPDITAAAASPDARAVQVRDPFWLPTTRLPDGADVTLEDTTKAVRRFRDTPPPALSTPSLHRSVQLHRRGAEPIIFPGTECQDCGYMSLGLSPDGSLASVGYGLSNDVLLRVYRTGSGEELPELRTGAYSG